MTRKRDKYDNDAQRWTAVCTKDPQADGRFFFAVKTTGIYCRPSCGARTPIQANVMYFNTVDEAEANCFRPCKRCKPKRKPNEDMARIIAAACRDIEMAEAPLSLQELADRAGYSSTHFHRVFKAMTGVTPKAYAKAQRNMTMRRELRQDQSITDAIYNAGYQTGSRFYADSKAQLGMTPSSFRQGGKGMQIRFAVRNSIYGCMLVAATDLGVCAIQLGQEQTALLAGLKEQFPQAALCEGDENFVTWVDRALTQLVAAKTPDKELPLDIRGTVFQQQVWRALLEIPRGETRTYGQIAQQLGKPKATRAVAAACAANKLALAIPCHRVIPATGKDKIGGYRWGRHLKQTILHHETTGEPAGKGEE